MKSELVIDGSQGEGGGQILPTALSLAVLQGRAVRIERIRAGRSKPGLQRQHLTCVNAAQAISNAVVEGAHIGSTCVQFTPREPVNGEHHFQIGTAGSTMLVLQKILPPLLAVKAPCRIRIEGGTHNMLAPTACFIQRCFLPVLTNIGARVALTVERIGLFPAGGGSILLDIKPAALAPLLLLERGEAIGIGALALVAGVPESVATRELAAVAKHFKVPLDQLTQQNLAGTGPGNVLSVWAAFENACGLSVAHGARGVASEQVAKRACNDLARYLRSDAPVCEYLADQLLLPMALAGKGSFITNRVTEHLRTNIAVIAQFHAGRFSVNEVSKVAWQVDYGG